MGKISIYLLAALLFLFTLGCEKTEELVKIDFEDTVELAQDERMDKSVINICVGSMITPREGYVYYKELLDYIGKRLGMKVNFVEKRTYQEVDMLLETGRIDVAFVCGGPYVEGHDRYGLELLVAPQVDGKVVYYSYIIVHKDSEIEKFEDLKGMTFAFVDPMSNTGKLVPTYILSEMGERPGTFFKEFTYTYAHDKSIKAVAQHIVDGAAVDSLIWEYMDKRGSEYTKDTKIIEVSDPYGIPPVVVYPGLREDLKRKLKGIFLSIHNEQDGRQILEEMFIDRFIDISDSAYDSIREIKRSVER